MSRTHSIILGSNAPIDVQLFPVDSDTGSNGIDLSGATGFSAKADDGNGNVVNFSNVVVTDALNGKIALQYLTTSFTVIGTYDIQITFTDSGGDTHIYPSDGFSLKLNVVRRIT